MYGACGGGRASGELPAPDIERSRGVSVKVKPKKQPCKSHVWTTRRFILNWGMKYWKCLKCGKVEAYGDLTGRESV